MHATTKLARNEPSTATALAVDLAKEVFELAFDDAGGRCGAACSKPAHASRMQASRNGGSGKRCRCSELPEHATCGSSASSKP